MSIISCPIQRHESRAPLLSPHNPRSKFADFVALYLSAGQMITAVIKMSRLAIQASHFKFTQDSLVSRSSTVWAASVCPHCRTDSMSVRFASSFSSSFVCASLPDQ